MAVVNYDSRGRKIVMPTAITSILTGDWISIVDEDEALPHWTVIGRADTVCKVRRVNQGLTCDLEVLVCPKYRQYTGFVYENVDIGLRFAVKNRPSQPVPQPSTPPAPPPPVVQVPPPAPKIVQVETLEPANTKEDKSLDDRWKIKEE